MVLRYYRLAVGSVPALLSIAVSADPIQQPPVVVTATRSPQGADVALAGVTVITRAEIERRQPRDLLELLRTETGVDLTRAGGPGGNTSLFLRGTNSNHVLVLVDGVRAASASTGIYEWRNLPVSQIERIEIVRGPRASLYGSDAVGGVIHIFTRQPRGTNVALGVGTHEAQGAEVAIGAGGDTTLGVAASHYETDGLSAQNPRGFSFDPDDDRLRQQAVTAGSSGAMTEALDWSLRAHQSDSRFEFDRGDIDLLNRIISARLEHRPDARWTHDLQLGYAEDDLATRSGFPSHFTTRRRSADWLHHLAIGPQHRLTVGVSHTRDAVRGRNPVSSAQLFDTAVRDNAAFGLWQGTVSAFDVELALRHDDHSTFGGHGTGSIAVGRRMGDNLRGWISYGTAFRAPTLNELFHPGTGGLFAGNPALGPERARSTEIGLTHRPNATDTIQLRAYTTRIRDLIVFQGPAFRAINLARARIRGTEFEYTRAVEAWRFRTSVTFQRARDATTDAPLLLRADEKFALTVERAFAVEGVVGAEVLMVGPRPDFARTLPGYALLNMSVRYPLRRSLMIEGRLENALDKEYQLIDGFNPPDRSVFVALRYSQP